MGNAVLESCSVGASGPCRDVHKIPNEAVYPTAQELAPLMPRRKVKAIWQPMGQRRSRSRDGAFRPAELLRGPSEAQTRGEPEEVACVARQGATASPRAIAAAQIQADPQACVAGLEPGGI
mmetsp:Transcript_41068/g.89731  ORF Transcript_41068/g.89731 Transcript_41068/m.89731 type:complete len:121 (+) Transcript_41068:46-408(+)